MGELDMVFQALADGRRRHAITCLQKHHTVSLADLAEFVAEKEQGADRAEISDEQVRDIYLSLYHTHLPKLEAAQFVHYEQQHDMVVRTEDTRSTLEEARDSVISLLQDA